MRSIFKLLISLFTQKNDHVHNWIYEIHSTKVQRVCECGIKEDKMSLAYDEYNEYKPNLKEEMRAKPANKNHFKIH